MHSGPAQRTRRKVNQMPRAPVHEAGRGTQRENEGSTSRCSSSNTAFTMPVALILRGLSRKSASRTALANSTGPRASLPGVCAVRHDAAQRALTSTLTRITGRPRWQPACLVERIPLLAKAPDTLPPRQEALPLALHPRP